MRSHKDENCSVGGFLSLSCSASTELVTGQYDVITGTGVSQTYKHEVNKPSLNKHDQKLCGCTNEIKEAISEPHGETNNEDELQHHDLSL